MSRIEQEAIPIASPLILGRAVSINADAQIALASLLCLITMRLEFTDQKTRGIPVEDRIWLRNSGLPPSNWKIWIARYIGTVLDQHWSAHHGMQIVLSPDDYTGPCNTQVTTMILGELCAHTFSSTVISDFQGYEGANLLQIWPDPRPTIDWMITLGISDKGVVRLSEALVHAAARDL